jgi:ubiquinone/menaquinone biosynthesis C-methylase UbiE
MPRFDADWIDYLLQPARRGSPPAEEILAQLGIRPGETIADVGCGPGFFTIAAGQAVGPTGRVVAVELERSMLDLVQAAAAEAGLSNVEVRQSTDGPLPLENGLADLTLCALVLHDLPEPLSVVRELARITRPAGRIAVVEWIPQDNEQRPNRLRPDQVTELLAQVGRRTVDVRQISDQQYLLIAN